MQTDVVSKYTEVSALIELGRTRVKGFVCVPGATLTGLVGRLVLFDTDLYSTPRSITYGRAVTTGLITVTDTAHGLLTGDMVGLVLESGTGGTGTTGNYAVTVTGANTYTVIDVNGVSAVTAGAAGTAAKRWILTAKTIIGATAPTMLTLPGEGILAYYGIYAQLTNITSASVYHG